MKNLILSEVVGIRKRIIKFTLKIELSIMGRIKREMSGVTLAC